MSSQKNSKDELWWTNFWLYMIWVTLTFMLLSGCSAGYHLQRAQHHLEVAQRKDPSITHIKRESTKQTIIRPELKVDFKFPTPKSDGVVVVDKKKDVVIKYIEKHDTTFIDVTCPPDTVVMWKVRESSVSQVPCTYKEMFKQLFGVGNVLYYIIHTVAASAITVFGFFKLVLPIIKKFIK